MKKLFLIIGALIVVAIVIVAILRPRNQAEATVDAGEVTRKNMTAIVSCSGTIQPKRKVDVSANAMGTIVHLAVDEGQRVAAGDLLLEIDPAAYRSAVLALQASLNTGRADLRLAEASLKKARQDQDRFEALFDEGLASEEELASARTSAIIEDARVASARHRIDQYKANLAKAEHDLEKVTITAPMAGVISRLNVEEGENAIMGTLNNPGTVLLIIADLGTMEAWVEVDETEVVDVQLGQAAEIEIDAFTGKSFSGKVTEIGNSPIRLSTGSSREAVEFEVKITLDEVIPKIRPGLSAKAEITVAERDSALAVPLGAVTIRDWPLSSDDIRRYSGRRARKQKAALQEYGFGETVTDTDSRDAEGTEGTEAEQPTEKEGVFVIHEGFTKFVPVLIGIAGEDDFEVIGGLTEGDLVVTGPFSILRELKDGSQIKTRSGGSSTKRSGS